MKRYYYVLWKQHYVYTSNVLQSLDWCEHSAKYHGRRFKMEYNLPCDAYIYVICKNGVHRKLKHYFLSA